MITKTECVVEWFKKGTNIEPSDLILLPREEFPVLLAAIMNEVSEVRRKVERRVTA